MQTYISILRGINVGGNRLIKMELLISLYKSLGFTDCQSYIQSGNLLFRSESENSEDLANTISKKIQDIFGFEVPVIVLTYEELKLLIEENPLLKDLAKDVGYLHVTVLASLPEGEKCAQMKQMSFEPEQFEFIGRWAYLYCPNGYGNSKLTNGFFERKLMVKATTRNWKTFNELLRIAERVNSAEGNGT